MTLAEGDLIPPAVWDKGVPFVILVAVGFGLWRVGYWLAERVVTPLVGGWLKKMEADTATSQQNSAILATLGLNVVNVGKDATTAATGVQAIQVEMKMDTRFKRVLLRIWKVWADHAQIDIDRELGEAEAILDDGSAEMRALTDADIQSERAKTQARR